jgi:hypothetical protein
MSDLTDSLLPAPALSSPAPTLTSGLGLDASAIDKNLRSIRQVESTWRLPALPDDVRLDLAANSSIAPETLSSFLYGLDRDYHGENDEDPVDEGPTIPTFRIQSSLQTYDEIEQTAFERAAGMITSLRGLPQSEVLDANAVQRFKMKAIEGGFMNAPENGVIDGSWSSELSSVQREMQFQEYDDKLRGDRFGAMPMGGENGVLKLLNDWTSPSGLMRAAVDLDLFWDAGQIGKEFSSWGDKWRKVGDSKNVLDFGKNLFDAMTGPVDDIVVPALNMALLFSGVGAGVNFARLGLTGVKGAQAVRAFQGASRLYEVPKIGGIFARVFPALDTVEAASGAVKGLGQASMLAERLRKGGTAASAAGDALAAWRAYKPVIATRRVVQTGMRLGFVNQVEELLPGYEGMGLSDIPGVAEAADRALLNPYTSIAGEWAFTPFTMFEPGTFVRGGQDAVRAAFKFLGTAPGRAVVGGVAGAGIGALEGDTESVLTGAAVGAGVGVALPGIGEAGVTVAGKLPDVMGFRLASKMIGHPSQVLARTSFLPIAEDQRNTAVFLQALERKLEPEAWDRFQGTMREKGFIDAFAEHIGSDREGASAAMAYVLTSAAIDRTAALQAGDRSSKGWRQRYWFARNQLVAQIRNFDENTTKEDLVWNIVTRESGSRRGLRRRFEQAIDVFDEPTLAEAIGSHNENARKTLAQLLSGENLPTQIADERQAGIIEYIGNALDSFGRWGEYSPLTGDLRRHVSGGLLEDVRIKAPKSLMGRKLKIFDLMEDFEDPIDPDKVDWAQNLNDTFFVERGVSAEQWRQAGGYYNPLAREIDPNRARITLARKETLSKQHMIETADEIQDVLDLHDAWIKGAKIIGNIDGQPVSVIADAKLGTLGLNEVKAYLDAAGITDAGQRKTVLALNRLAKSRGLTVDQAFDSVLRQHMDSFATDVRWSETYKMDPMLRGQDGEALQGIAALKARQKALREEAKFKAADLDIDDAIAEMRAAGKTAEADELEAFARHADEQGYKVVYGADFLAPDEVLHQTGMFVDINHRHQNAMTLGNFFGRKHPEALAAKVQRYRTLAIAKELGRARGATVDVESGEMSQIIGDLYTHILDPALELNSSLSDDLAHSAWLAKRGAAIKNADAPRSLMDLGLGKHRDRVVSKLTKLGYSERDAAAIWQGLKAGRYADFKDQGLYAIEAKLRGKNQALGALQFFSGTKSADTLMKRAENALKSKGTISTGLVGASAGAITAQATSDEQDVDPGRILAGAGAGLLGGMAGSSIVGVGAGRLADKLDYTEWARYGYIADNLAAFRDKMRFTLSPFFDISRYTEAFVLNQIATPGRAADGVTRAVVPLNASPKKLRKAIGDAAFNRTMAEMKAVSQGRYEPEMLDTAGRWFREIGIMGFDPTAWQASTYHHLRTNGLDPEAAWEAVQKTYHYGTQGRSAAEMSVNFVFFPFSFQKKTITHAAQFLADDMMRGVLLHDAYKAYEFLNERYDLDTFVDERLPVLEPLARLNLFAYGISPGRLGGINAPFVDALVGNPLDRDPAKQGLLFNLFNPVGVNISDTDDLDRGQVTIDTLQRLVKRSLPVINDVKFTLEDAKEQGHVIMSPSHMTRAAETAKAYDEWGSFKKGIDQALKQSGASFYDLYNNPGMAPLLEEYKLKKLELERKYPGWVDSKLRAQANRAELEQERQTRLDTVAYSPEEATATDLMFVQVEQEIASIKAYLEGRGITEIEDWPPEMQERVRGVGIEMAANPAFERLWKRFYARDFGPITSKVG